MNIKMDKLKFLNNNHKSRTNCSNHYQNESLQFNYYNFNRFKLFFTILTSLVILNQFQFARAFHLPGQQAPPTSLTIKKDHKYNTTYACEGSQLTINCDQPGTEINVIRSNFGRFSISICNSQGVLDWSVNCFSKNTVELIRRACNGQRQCLLQASTDLFGNPCPNTYKYLEVHYECTNKEQQTVNVDSIQSSASQASSHLLPKININLPVNNVISSDKFKKNAVSAPPPIIIPDNPLLKHNHPTPNKHQPSIPIVPIYTTPPSSISNLFSTLNKDSPSNSKISSSSDIENNGDLFFNNNNNNAPRYPQPSLNDNTNNQNNNNQNSPLFCPSVFERGLNWNRTEIDSYITQPCPSGSTGLAQWFCSPPTNNPSDQPSIANQPHWVPTQPIFAQCQSTWLTQINRRMTNGESALLLSEELSNLITETNQLYGGDIRGITDLLRVLLQPLELMIAQHHQQEQTKITKEMLAVSIYD